MLPFRQPGELSTQQLIGFNHGAHAGEYAEIQSVIRSSRRPRGPSLDRFAAKNQLGRRELDVIGGRTDHNQFAVRSEAVNQRGHGFGTGGRGQDDPRSPEFA